MPATSVTFSLRASSISSRHAHLLQLGDVDLALLDLLVPIVRVVPHAAIRFVRQLFGQRQRPVRVIVVRIGVVRGVGRAMSGRAGLGAPPGVLAAFAARFVP